MKRKRKRKRKTFEQAKKEIEEKFDYLELLEFTTNDGYAVFRDKEYGEFYVKLYKNVLYGFKNHPIRSALNKKNKTKNTCLEKYGVKSNLQLESCKNKIKKTNLEKYGVEYPMQNKNIQNKTKNTCLEKYGTPHTLQSEKIKEKIRKTNLKKYGVENPFQSEEIKEKTKQTNLKKYGCESPFGNKNIQKKIKQTNLEKYGVEYTLQDKNIREQIKQTNLEKYGVENPFASEAVKEKIKETNLDKYGTKNPQQNKEIRKKTTQTNLEKYGVECVLQNKNIKNKTKQINIDKGNYYNINGQSLIEYYNNSDLSDKFAYSTVQQNYNTYGDQALNIDHYNETYGKSKIANLWLAQIEEELGYILIKEYPFDPDNKRLRSDGYDPKTNTIYEFYGDYWHGNLEVFAADKIHQDKNKTMQELYNATIEREVRIKELGYELISIWENDYIIK